MDTSELVHKARKGDADAFGDLMKACQEKLYRIAYSYVKNKEDALDIVSESVYKAYVSLRTLRNPEYFNTWIIRIVINQSINYINKNRRIFLNETFSHVYVKQESITADEAIELHDAMDRLDTNQKTVVILKYFEDLTLTQIAEIMKRPVGTVKTYLHNALKNLQLEMKEVFQ